MDDPNGVQKKPIPNIIDKSTMRQMTLALSGQNNLASSRNHTDSQTTIHKLFNKWSTSKQLTNTVTKLQHLQVRHNLRIEKVKAHANIEGNEIADTLAKEATKYSRQTQNEAGLNKAIIKTRLQSWLKEKNIEQLKKKNYNTFTTAIITKIYREYGKLYFTNKQTMRQMTLALSGQNNLASSRNHEDKKVNPNCELCGVKENSEHVIIVCPRLDELKHKLGYKKRTINMEVYGEDSLNLPKLTKLITKSGIFREEQNE